MDGTTLAGDVVSLRIIKAKTGSQGAEIAVRLRDGRSVICKHWFTDQDEDRTWGILETLGFNGDFERAVFSSPACSVQETPDEYRGRTTMKYRIQSEDRAAQVPSAPVSRAELASLSGRWARRGGRTPPAGPAPKPAVAPQHQPPPAGAGGAEQQASDIPF
jgi:hypothetical protein